MIKIGKVILGNLPKVVLTITDSDTSSFIKKAISKGVDILELRIDRFRSLNLDYVKKIISSVSQYKLPLIVTIRSKKEGGAKYISDNKRLKLFDVVMPLVDVVDIELYSKNILNKITREAHSKHKKVIVSYHNFKGTPKDEKIVSIIKKINNTGADIIKIAVLANNTEDVKRLANITLQHKKKNLITVSLGTKGMISRIFFPILGSLLTYTCINTPVAPGQLSIDFVATELKKFCLYPD